MLAYLLAPVVLVAAVVKMSTDEDRRVAELRKMMADPKFKDRPEKEQRDIARELMCLVI